LLRIVLGTAIWQGGELRMSFQPPFEQLQLSNSASTRNGKAIPRNGVVFDNWRCRRDSNRRRPAWESIRILNPNHLRVSVATS
jgi:hypothetical protein